jgi:two-component system, OmpR family, response regulator
MTETGLLSVPPSNLAVIDDDAEFADYLAQFLIQHGVRTRVFPDSDDFLTASGTYEFDFYVIDLSLPGVDGLDLVRLVRRKSESGIVVVSGRIGANVLESVLRAGADMYLMKPLSFEQVALAIEAVQRRIQSGRSQAAVWRLDRAARKLIAPDGARIDLSDNDLAIVECFIGTDGAAVTRAALQQSLGREPTEQDDNMLAATIYRLRRRIERATSSTVPVHAEQRVGYSFRGKLIV